MKKCQCDTKKPAKVLTVTQLDAQTVLEPENLEKRDSIWVLSKNINDTYTVKVMSCVLMKDIIKAVKNPEAAFILVEMKKPAASVGPGTTNPATTPENPDNPGNATEEDPTKEEKDNNDESNT